MLMDLWSYCVFMTVTNRGDVSLENYGTEMTLRKLPVTKKERSRQEKKETKKE
jgi:hypothetical protein